MRQTLFHVLMVTSALTVLPVMARADDAAALASSPAPVTAPVPATTNGQTAAVNPGQDVNGLLNLSLQQLSDIEVTSVSKKAEKASQAPAAIYVITQEDIRRSGLQSVPELLRMVPGLQVAQSGSQNWAVTSRGFDGQFANKLLVMIDGRTVYSPVFSGVQWDVQNVMLEDIERIEVIRGPGATLWGANAVNGVINIITKSAKDTQGTLLTAATGNQERLGTSGRYGGTVGDLSYRTYAQYFNDNQEHTVATPSLHVNEGQGGDDQWHNAQGGFRLDWGTPDKDKDQTTLQGDVYKGQENSLRFLPTTSTVNPNLVNVVNDTDDVSGGNLLGRWKHEISSGSSITLQGYYDDVIRETEFAGISYDLQTYDLDFQHNLTLNPWNDITWGLGYRSIRTNFGNSFYISFNPEDHNDNLFSGFLQDKISLIQDELFLTLGSKLEHNDYTEFEYEPSAKLSWLPTSNQTVWASVSRAVHAANQANQDLDLALSARPTGGGFPTSIASEIGNPQAGSEDLVAYELGYRVQPRENISLDLTAFLNEYSHLSSNTQETATIQFSPTMGQYVLVPEVVGNNNNGETHGFEAAATWEATKHIKISGSYTLFNSDLNIVGPSLVTAQGNAPHQQFNLRSYVDLPYDMQFDTMLYRVNELTGVGLPATPVPAYTRLDMRLGWTPIQGVDLSLIGQNLLQSEHEEYAPFLYETTEEIGRSVLAKATLRF